MAEGRQLFVRFNCSGCHGGRAGGGMGPSLRDVDWLYGNRDAQMFSSIAEGRAHGMPSWQPRLTADQIWKLVTYIKSLRTRERAEPAADRIEDDRSCLARRAVIVASSSSLAARVAALLAASEQPGGNAAGRGRRSQSAAAGRRRQRDAAAICRRPPI